MSVLVSGYLKTSLVEIASAVERMVLPVDPDFEKDQVNDAENLIIHDRLIPRKGKRPKREMKNGGGMLNCFLSFLSCVCVPFTIAKQQQLLRSCESFNVTFNWLAFFRFLDRFNNTEL